MLRNRARDAQSLPHFLLGLSQDYGERPYLQFRDSTYTYAEFDEMCARTAGGLRSIGVTRGSTVAVMLPNCPEMLFTWLGASRLGAIHVPINTGLKGESLAYVLGDCDARVLVIDQAYLPALETVWPSSRGVDVVVVRGDSVPPPMVRATTMNWQALPAADPVDPEAALQPGDPCVIQYTSGTTGLPKGAVLPHGYWPFQSVDLAEVMRLTHDDVVMAMMPLFHVGAPICGVLAAHVVGARLVLAERYSASRFWSDVRRHRVTYFHFVGLVLGTLMAQPPQPDDADNPATRAFGIPVPANMHREFETRFGIRLVTSMGTTEVGNITITDLDDRTPGSVGRPVPGWEVAILDEADNALPPGQVGEFGVRPQRPSIMTTGYYKRPEATISSCGNLWFHTGDLGVRDEDGQFHFVDRKKDVIRYRGEMVSAYQVEQAICSHPDVLEAAVIPIPDPINEEEIKACVVLKDDHHLPVEDLLAYCEEQLPSFAVPRYFEFKQQLPKTGSEKIEKYKLREEGVTSVTWDKRRRSGEGG